MSNLLNPESRWSALLRVTRAWRLEWQAGQLLARVAKEAVEFLGQERGVVWLAGRNGLSVGARWPLENATGSDEHLSYSREVAQAVLHTGRSVFARETPREPSAPDAPAAELRLVYCVPLTATRGVLGALYLEALETTRGLASQDQEFLEMLGLQAAAALEHALLYQSAITDPLTGLFSHRHFQQEVEQAVRRANRTSHPLALIILDLDRFKALNDSRGHEEGNRCLTWIAGQLRETLRASDVVARFGGDEFEILLPDTTGADALKVAEKIRLRLETGCNEQGFPVTATFGVSAFPDNAADGQTLFLHADEALYQAKEQGRNRTMLSRVQVPARPAPGAQRSPSPPGSSGVWLPSLSGIRPVVGDAAQASRATAEEQVDGYRVIRRLGMGASGEVLLVQQPELEREVALKRPFTPHLTQEQALAFELEAKITASLNHPGVITVLTMGRDLDGRRYYTMKPLRGQSLAEILVGRKEEVTHFLRTYTLWRLLEILQRASETLAYAHQQGVVHLDLTPSNIIVGEFGEVTLIDWGSGTSSSRDRQTAPNAAQAASKPGSRPAADGARMPWLTGSPAYLAPEHLPGGGVPGPSTDVYALGSMLYEILVGQPPFLRATTRQTLEAVAKEEYLPPERARPEAGIDPSLSELCRLALLREQSQRLSAAEFSDRLSRFIRREQEWEVVRFGAGGHALREEEWHAFTNPWRLQDGYWSTTGSGDQTLVWKVPVAGSFRFVCEAWTEGGGAELALIGCGAAPGMEGRRILEGYWFEFGADFGTLSKMARHGHDVLVRPGLTPEPGRKYRLEIAYEEGWLHCFVDDQRVFTYRELFPFLGRHVGFYSFYPGAHFRPLELHRQNWGLQVPAIRVADDLYRHGSYEAALERYQQLAELYRHRLEGDEARLKVGICQSRLKRWAAAREIFHDLQGSQLEPFALAEEALMDLDVKNQEGRPERAVENFALLLSRFPENQAKASILEAASREQTEDPIRHGMPLEQELEWRLALQRLGSATLTPPAYSQVKCHVRATLLLLRLGRYAEALSAALAFEPKATQFHATFHIRSKPFFMAVLAQGRDELLPAGPLNSALFPLALLTHYLARRGAAQAFLEARNAGSFKDLESDEQYRSFTDIEIPPALFSQAILEALLLLHQKAQAAVQLEHAARTALDYPLFRILLSARNEAWFTSYLKKSEHAQGSVPAGRDYSRILRARWHLEGGNREAAVRELEGATFPETHLAPYDSGLLLQVLLSTLKLLKHPQRKELERRCGLNLAGADLDLAHMLLEKKPPQPGERWPHPLWEPERRLWLALWLEARGERAQARAIAQPARDPRYGLTHSQPALAALLERVGG